MAIVPDVMSIREDDTFFTCPEGRLKLREFSQDQGELIFYQRSDSKGPKESFYVRTPTGEPESLRQVLTLAHGVTGRVRKKRTLYLIGRTRVHIDDVEGLGHFVELEVVLDDNESLESGYVRHSVWPVVTAYMNVRRTSGQTL